MEDLLITTIFLLVMFTPVVIAIWIKELKTSKKPSVIRHRYDTVYNWFYNQYAKELTGSVNLPDFMNRELMKKAHEKAVYIAQSGKLNQAYRQILRYKSCV